MLHLFEKSLSLFEDLKSEIKNAASEAQTKVQSSITWAEHEVLAGASEAFKELDVATLSVATAFEAGAKWAAARVSAATATPEPGAETVAPNPEVVAEQAPAVVESPAAVEVPVAPNAAPVADAGSLSQPVQG
jgi:hypothetical protein